MPGSEGPRVLLAGEAIEGLVRAIAQMAAADLGPYAIVGGIAVAARLGQAHRVTRDVDTVVDQDHLRAAIAVLRGMPTATADPPGDPSDVTMDRYDTAAALGEEDRIFALGGGTYPSYSSTSPPRLGSASSFWPAPARPTPDGT